VRAFTCDICRLVIPEASPVLFALQDRGTGPYTGMSGWYTATVHAEPCGTSFLREADDYRERLCRGCHRPMWQRARSRRAHCSDQCRQRDYRRRRDLHDRVLQADDRVLYRDDLYWHTRPEAISP
jgi:hypothetical protein